MQLEIPDKKVNMQMKEYLQDCIEDFPEEITSSAKTPATKLSTKVCKTFHSIVQKLLHVAKRSQLGLHVSIGFLCTRTMFGELKAQHQYCVKI